MAETYSIAATGAAADNAQRPKNITLGDSGGGRHGDRLNSMMLGTPFLCQGPDGSQAWYKLDETRFWDGQYNLIKVT